VTFSIVATNGSAWGVAVASKYLAVGAAVPAARAGTGAIATQSLANLAYRGDGLAHLAAGKDAQQTLDALTAADALREQRQAGVVDAAGRAATFTGGECLAWAGGVTGDGYAIQGNILTGPEVVAAMEDAWRGSDPAAALGRRLLAALVAGDEAGGDRRGRQSAAVFVVTEDGAFGGGSDVHVDLRIDDHPAPVPELMRLLDLHDVFFGRVKPDMLRLLTGELLQEVRAKLTALGHDGGDVEQALGTWAGIENLEERLRPGAIDPVVLARLRSAAASDTA
jgi:uncharacterized Ntn-hydrolase superfamily protein